MIAWIARVLVFSLAVIAPLANTDPAITHLLDRVTFGARPGDIEHVRETGVERYIDEQLHPDRLSDSALVARLADFETLRMSSSKIAQEFEMPLGQPPQEQQKRAALVVLELQQQKILRAAYSTRQLQEVLVDFWFNHFNVDARKGADRFLLTEYERDVLRPHVLGKFRDLLEATAKSPAMLFYLDNWMSADPNGPHAGTGDGARGRFGAMI